jgi:hypothetical protein
MEVTATVSPARSADTEMPQQRFNRDSGKRKSAQIGRMWIESRPAAGAFVSAFSELAPLTQPVA